MSTKKFLKIYLFICIFPVWILSEKILFSSHYIFFIPYALLYLSLVPYIDLEKNYKFTLFIVSFLSVFAIDQNLSLSRSLIKPNFESLNNLLNNIYFAEIILILILFIFIYITFYKFGIKSIKIFFSFIFVIFVFKIAGTIFNPIEIVNFNSEKKKDEKKISAQKTLFIIFDEMSGVNSTEKNFKFGDDFVKTIHEFAEKNNFQLYLNSYSTSDNTANAVPLILNFNANKVTQNFRDNHIKKSNNTYNEYNLMQNALFDKFSSVSVLQNIHLNFCNNQNVSKCYQINPYNYYENYLNGFKNNILSRFLSLWKLDGSSSSKLLWKLTRIIGITDSTLEPEAHKIFLPTIMDEIKKDVLDNKFDLVFAHILSPHIPYGFNRQCDYDGRKSSFNTRMTTQEKYIQHNLERICMMRVISSLINELKNEINYEDLQIFFMSDHGSRITNKEKFSSILLTKKKNQKFKTIDATVSVQEIIKKSFDKD